MTCTFAYKSLSRSLRKIFHVFIFLLRSNSDMTRVLFRVIRVFVYSTLYQKMFFNLRNETMLNHNFLPFCDITEIFKIYNIFICFISFLMSNQQNFAVVRVTIFYQASATALSTESYMTTLAIHNKCRTKRKSLTLSNQYSENLKMNFKLCVALCNSI